MVMHRNHPNHRGQHGALSTEFMVALAMLFLMTIPLIGSWMAEARAVRGSYFRAVAMELVDGEIECLAAGGWRNLQEGAQPYTVRAAAATNLPPGAFTATLQERTLRLEWKPARRLGSGQIVRTVQLP